MFCFICFLATETEVSPEAILVEPANQSSTEQVPEMSSETNDQNLRYN